MKRNETIRESLGLTQSEMAILLRINRAQWSMYESGKRSLPTPALVILSEMLVYLQQTETDKVKNSQKASHQEKLLQKEYKSLLHENRYQQLAASRNLASMERKYEAQTRTLELASYLQSKAETQTEKEFLKTIVTRATKGIEKNGLHLQARIRLQQAMLEEEEKWLMKRVKKIEDGK